MTNKTHAVLTFTIDKERLNLTASELLDFLEEYDRTRMTNWYYKADKYEWNRDELKDFVEKISTGDHRIGAKEAIFLLYLHTNKIYLIPAEGITEDYEQAIRVKLYVNKQTYHIRLKQKYPELSFT